MARYRSAGIFVSEWVLTLCSTLNSRPRFRVQGLQEGIPLRWDIWAKVRNSSIGNRCPLKLMRCFRHLRLKRAQADRICSPFMVSEFGLNWENGVARRRRRRILKTAAHYFKLAHVAGLFDCLSVLILLSDCLFSFSLSSSLFALFPVFIHRRLSVCLLQTVCLRLCLFPPPP